MLHDFIDIKLNPKPQILKYMLHEFIDIKLNPKPQILKYMLHEFINIRQLPKNNYVSVENGAKPRLDGLQSQSPPLARYPLHSPP